MRNSCSITFKIKYRSHHRNCSVKRSVLKNFANFTVKHLCWSLFINKFAILQSASYLKRDSNASAFLWNLQNFKKRLFWRTSANDCFWRFSIKKLVLKSLIRRTNVASDKCSVKKSINILTPCGCFLQENTCVGVSF